MRKQHQPKCPFEAACSICQPTHLEQLIRKYGTLTVGEGISIPFVIALPDGKEISGDTLELAALKILMGLQ
jgi:hypothetical protein